MFETLRWHKAQNGAEAAMHHAVQSLAQVGKAPIVIGSIAAMALLGMVTGMGLTHKGRGRAKVLAARAKKAAESTMSAPRNGARRKARKAKGAGH